MNALTKLDFDTLVQVRVPSAFAEALNKAARNRMMSRADFIRFALSETLFGPIERMIVGDCEPVSVTITGEAKTNSVNSAIE